MIPAIWNVSIQGNSAALKRLDQRLDKERSRSGPSISEVNEQIAPDTRRRSLTLRKSTEFRKPGDTKRPNKRRLDTPARPVPLHRSLTTTRDEIRVGSIAKLLKSIVETGNFLSSTWILFFLSVERSLSRFRSLEYPLKIYTCLCTAEICFECRIKFVKFIIEFFD